MSTRLAAVLLLAVPVVGPVAACGEDRPSTTATEPTGPTEPTEPTETTETEPTAVDVVEVISTSLGGGAVDRRPVELAPDDHLDELVAGLEAGMPTQVRRAAVAAERDPGVRRALAEGRRLLGAVVWVGCETPREVIVTGQGAALEVRAVVPDKGPDGGTVQCLVPVTTVALFLV